MAGTDWNALLNARCMRSSFRLPLLRPRPLFWCLPRRSPRRARFLWCLFRPRAVLVLVLVLGLVLELVLLLLRLTLLLSRRVALRFVAYLLRPRL